MNEANKPVPSFVTVPLPDGTSLKAVAYEGETYPGINVYWCHGPEQQEELICMAEYNPDRKPGDELCVGVYQTNQEDTVYYESYWTDGVNTNADDENRPA